MVRERTQFDSGQYPANVSVFDKSGSILVVGCEDGKAYAYNIESGEILKTFAETNNMGSVHDLVFDPNGKFLVAGSSDSSFRIWS